MCSVFLLLPWRVFQVPPKFRSGHPRVFGTTSIDSSSVNPPRWKSAELILISQGNLALLVFLFRGRPLIQSEHGSPRFLPIDLFFYCYQVIKLTHQIPMCSVDLTAREAGFL